MPEPQYSDLTFPLAGVDKQGEFGQQRAGTTPTGANVRGLDPRTRRRRGATRPGLSKYVPLQVDGTATLIQHLNVVVDPTTEALLVNFVDDYGLPGGDNQNPDTVTDDSTNNLGPDPGDPDFRNPDGRVIPDGGSGVDLSPDQPPGTPGGGGGSGGWEFVQKKAVTAAFGPGASRTDEATFDAPTELDQMIVAVLYSGTDFDTVSESYPPDVAVTDTLGNTYAVARYEVETLTTAGFSRSLVYVAWARNEAGGACTVRVTQTSTAPSGPVITGSQVVALEYRGLETSTPADGNCGDAGAMPNDGSAPTGTMGPGPVPIGGQTRLVLGVIQADGIPPVPDYAAASGWTVRHNDAGCLLLEKLSSGASAEPTVDYDHSGNPFDGFTWVAAGCGWRYR